jgi:hypothetical protein
MGTPLPLEYNIGRGFSRLRTIRDYLNNVGERASGLLRVSGNVADGNIVVIGADSFVVYIINTDTNVNLEGAIDDNDTIIATNSAMATQPVVGDLLRLENEIVQVVRVRSTTSYEIVRGVSGTTPASHADDVDIHQSNAPGVEVAAGRIPVGLVTTLTPAVFTPALVDDINSQRGTSGNSAAVIAKSLETAAVMLIVARERGALALATTETGANLAWEAATMSGGLNPSRRRFYSGTRVPTAGEVTAGLLYIPLDFDPTAVFIAVRVTADGLAKAWDGAVTVVAAAGGFSAYILLNNAGSTDWAATDTIHIFASE